MGLRQARWRNTGNLYAGMRGTRSPYNGSYPFSCPDLPTRHAKFNEGRINVFSFFLFFSFFFLTTLFFYIGLCYLFDLFTITLRDGNKTETAFVNVTTR